MFNLRRLAAPFALLLIVTAFFWKLLLTNQYSWLESPDLAHQVLPWFDFEARQFHQHVFPMWDPLMLGGQSLIGQDQPGLAYPLNWILFALPLHNGHISLHILSWYYMSIHYFAALFCYWLCRDLELSEMASVAGGLSFGLGGYVGTVDWPQMINGAIWGPLVFLFLFRAVRGVRPRASAAFCGLFLGVSWLGGHHQIPIFLSLAVLAVWIYYLAGTGRLQRPLLTPLALFLGFFALAGALQMWPAFAYGRTAVRWVGAADGPVTWKQVVPYSVHRLYSVSPKYLLGTLIAGYADSNSAFAGVTALALAGLALARCWSRQQVRVLFAVGVGGLFLSLGSSDVFHGMLYSVLPMFEKARTPSTALYLFHFAIAVLLAFGMEEALRAAAQTTLRKMALGLAGFGTFLFLVIFGVFIAKGQTWNDDDRVMITVIAALSLSGLLYRLSRNESRHTGLAVLVTALYLLELGNNTAFALPHREETGRNIYLRDIDRTKELADYVRRQPGSPRVWINRDELDFNFGDWYGIDTVTGYVASMPQNFFDVETHTERGQALYGARYTIGVKPRFADQTEVFRSAGGLGIYESPNVQPRVWTVHAGVGVKDAAQARVVLQDPAFDLRTTGIFPGAVPAMESCGGDAVQGFSRETNSFATTVTMACRGMVVMSENNEPGWVAFVDGRATSIHGVDTALRGVMVGAGRHRIEMRYRPLSVEAGAAATLLAFLGAGALCFVRID